MHDLLTYAADLTAGASAMRTLLALLMATDRQPTVPTEAPPC